ncbi:MAG: carboxylesterase [Gammaproteobacteria bacterium HGW-Gammaproteobacteria-3]|nr:MAG: carboxylesterase [Gammaproteobacteria bacterium HGW-Gammaproteobacteria-3]
MKLPFDGVEILPKTRHRHSIIWLHGLGADGSDFEGIVPELGLSELLGIHFVFPNAPVQAVTINGGMAMRAWYDIPDMAIEHNVDRRGIEQSASLISQLIQHEMDQGIAAENILLAGFSQGGVMALHAGLLFPHKLAGILALSCYLPTLEQLKTKRSAANNSTPILMAHGVLDPVVPLRAAKAAREGLTALQYPVEWREYVMEHGLCLEEIKHISNFILTCFNA